MKIKNSLFIFSLSIILFSFFIASPAHASTGFIDPSVTDQAKVCHDPACSTPTPGIINFKLSAEPSITIDSVTGISGRVWGNELGWITMNPTGAGVRFADPTTGLLTGKAWSQVSGYINFAVTGESVTINPTTGEFSGWAWTGGPYGGWIKFDCGDASTCVKTTWRADGGSSGGGGSGGSGGSGGGGGGGPTGTTTTTPPSTIPTTIPTSSDVCPNIDGAQETIPSGYTVNVTGECVKIIDKCPNLDGNQSSVPEGYSMDSMGACVAKSPSSDACPNLPGRQKEVPDGYIVTSNGDCVKPTIPDLCANLSDTQSVVPAGYYEQSGNCFLLPRSPDTIPPATTTQQGEGGVGGKIHTGSAFLNNITDNMTSWVQGNVTALNQLIEKHLTWPIFILWILLLIALLYLLLRKYFTKK